MIDLYYLDAIIPLNPQEHSKVNMFVFYIM